MRLLPPHWFARALALAAALATTAPLARAHAADENGGPDALAAAPSAPRSTPSDARAARPDARADVERWLAARLDVPPEALKVEGFEVPFGLDRDERLVVDGDSLSGPLVGSIAIRARVARSGAADRYVSLRGKVALRRERLRVAHALPRGTILTASDVVADLVWDDGSQPLPEVEEVIGLETRRAIPVNQPLRPSDVGEPTLVKRGQPVRVDYLTPGISVVGTGRAIGDGRRGELVRIEMPGAARVIVGKVIAEGWVRASPESAAVKLGARR